MKKTFLFALALVVLAFAGAVMADDDAAAKDLFEDRCSLCHSSENATDMTDTPEGWREIVTRMRDENGCQLNDEEFETIIKYLSTHYGR